MRSARKMWILHTRARRLRLRCRQTSRSTCLRRWSRCRWACCRSSTATGEPEAPISIRAIRYPIDFLTPLHRGGTRPFRHPQLGITLQPLKFLEYLLQDVNQAVVFTGGGAAMVNVPDPARYALHKLVVAGERPASRIVKSNKDVQQAAALLAVLQEQAPTQVESAWSGLRGRGRGWSARLKRGRAALARAAPELEPERWLRLPGER